jgi:hypothetical protein
VTGLRIALEAPGAVAAGEPVAYKIVIRNGGSEPLDLYLQGREPVFDLRVADEAGVTVWRRLEGQTIQAILRVDTLCPGESMTFGDVWDQRGTSGGILPPGVYMLQAEVPTDGQPLVTQASELRVTTA